MAHDHGIVKTLREPPLDIAVGLWCLMHRNQAEHLVIVEAQAPFGYQSIAHVVVDVLGQMSDPEVGFVGPALDPDGGQRFVEQRLTGGGETNDGDVKVIQADALAQRKIQE